jgi:hypothetical protein
VKRRSALVAALELLELLVVLVLLVLLVVLVLLESLEAREGFLQVSQFCLEIAPKEPNRLVTVAVVLHRWA